MVKKIDHIGIAVKDLNQQIKYYTEILGLKCSDVRELPEQQVRLVFIPIGDTRLELLETTSPEGPIGKFLDRRDEGVHHIAYRVENLQGELVRIEEKKIRLIDKKPKLGANGHKIAFLHPKSTFGVLTELCE